jgi:hypothetical protein
MPIHPNKHIREAIKYAENQGWRVVKAGGQAHIWGKIYCPAKQRGGCIIRVYSTPRVPEHHARHVREEIADCPHGGIDAAD